MVDCINYVNNGEFVKLLKMSEAVKKGRTKELSKGWGLVQVAMLQQHPDFTISKNQIAEKWRK